MNLPALTNVQLPEHLRHLASNTALMTMNNDAASGIGVGGGHPRISIKQSRWRLQSQQGEEVVVPQLHLDVILVGANSNGLSKVYYAGKYDPAGEDKAPDCWSDNGVAPSNKATSPQCNSCANCPMNVWGSKISEVSGKQVKACSDAKKVAVIIADNPDGPVFELKIPAASLKNFAAYVDSLNKRNYAYSTVVTRLTFDVNASHPLIVFEASGWITAEQAAVVAEVINTDEVYQCTGEKDVPVDVTKAIAAPAPQQASAQTQLAAVTQNALPQAAMPVAPPLPPIPASPAFPIPPVSAAPAPVVDTPAPAKRGRKATVAPVAPPAADEVPAFLRGAVPPVVTPPAQPFVLPPVPNAAAAVAPLAPTGVTNSALDDMLAKAMAT